MKSIFHAIWRGNIEKKRLGVNGEFASKFVCLKSIVSNPGQRGICARNKREVHEFKPTILLSHSTGLFEIKL
jgi:hypothetical protein